MKIKDSWLFLSNKILKLNPKDNHKKKTYQNYFSSSKTLFLYTAKFNLLSSFTKKPSLTESSFRMLNHMQLVIKHDNSYFFQGSKSNSAFPKVTNKSTQFSIGKHLVYV